jgi:hypothetical protein
MADNVTPIGYAAKHEEPGPTELAKALDSIQHKVHLTLCTLECASAGLEKAENDDDGDLWVRAARVVERCCAELKEIRGDVDDATSVAVRYAALSGN